jgi:hypothetical protein
MGRAPEDDIGFDPALRVGHLQQSHQLQETGGAYAFPAAPYNDLGCAIMRTQGDPDGAVHAPRLGHLHVGVLEGRPDRPCNRAFSGHIGRTSDQRRLLGLEWLALAPPGRTRRAAPAPHLLFHRARFLRTLSGPQAGLSAETRAQLMNLSRRARWLVDSKICALMLAPRLLDGDELWLVDLLAPLLPPDAPGTLQLRRAVTPELMSALRRGVRLARRATARLHAMDVLAIDKPDARAPSPWTAPWQASLFELLRRPVLPASLQGLAALCRAVSRHVGAHDVPLVELAVARLAGLLGRKVDADAEPALFHPTLYTEAAVEPQLVRNCAVRDLFQAAAQLSRRTPRAIVADRVTMLAVCADYVKNGRVIHVNRRSTDALVPRRRLVCAHDGTLSDVVLHACSNRRAELAKLGWHVLDNASAAAQARLARACSVFPQAAAACITPTGLWPPLRDMCGADTRLLVLGRELQDDRGFIVLVLHQPPMPAAAAAAAAAASTTTVDTSVVRYAPNDTDGITVGGADCAQYLSVQRDRAGRVQRNFYLRVPCGPDVRVAASLPACFVTVQGLPCVSGLRLPLTGATAGGAIVTMRDGEPDALPRSQLYRRCYVELEARHVVMVFFLALLDQLGHRVRGLVERLQCDAHLLTWLAQLCHELPLDALLPRDGLDDLARRASFSKQLHLVFPPGLLLAAPEQSAISTALALRFEYQDEQYRQRRDTPAPRFLLNPAAVAPRRNTWLPLSRAVCSALAEGERVTSAAAIIIAETERQLTIVDKTHSHTTPPFPSIRPPFFATPAHKKSSRDSQQDPSNPSFPVASSATQ